jgi:tetratricopeptide (TPR) repeat protein
MLTDIAASPIAETMRKVSAEQRSGDLQVRSGRMVKTAFFDHGRLVFAASNLKKDRLGEAMVADGKITQEEFDTVSALMRGERKRFGDAMVRAGLADRYDVGGAVGRQVRRIALSFFELTDGAAIFEERECAIPLEYMVSLSIHRLLYDGIRQMKSEELVLKGLGALDRAVVMAAVPPFPYEPKARAMEEREILEHARRRVTIRRLGWAEGGLAFPRLRAAYALLAAGVLRDADIAPAAEPPVQAETGMFLLSALHRRPDPSLRDAIRKEVKQELAHSAHLDREAWLKVARSAPKAELVRALEEKMERYHALRDAVEEGDALRKELEVILGRASSALRLTRMAPDTGAAETATGRRAREEATAAMASTDPGSATPPPPAIATTPPPPVVAGTPPPPARTAPPTGAPPAAAALPASDTDPELQLTEEPAEPAVAAAATPAPAAEPGPRRRGEPRPDESLPGVKPGASGFSGKAQVEHLLMEGEVRMTVSDYANAVKVYEKLVKLAPKVSAFRLRLATAMACYPRTSKLAERQFFEASRLEPENADIHYQWGLYYKVMKIRARAVAEMRTAVRLNPRHAAARKELEALSPKDSALTSLRKLFGSGT